MSILDDDANSPAVRARALAAQLRGQGHHAQANRIEASLVGDRTGVAESEPGHGILVALRDACQTVLTAIEAIDPSSGTAIEDLRLEVDKRLTPHGVPHADPKEPLSGR